jgi:hypothetical protein
MSDITISVIQPPSTIINVGADETTLIQAGMNLQPHSVTHISGGDDELNHNLLGELQGGSNGQYYHLSSEEYFNLITGTGSFYPNNNPSGFITGVDLSFSGNYYTKTESESRYVNTAGAETILGDKTFHDKVYINNLYVTGIETIVNTTNASVESNYIILNLTGGAVDGGVFFVTGSGLTGINDSGAIIGFDHSDKFKFGIGTRASDLSTLNSIAAYEEVTAISGGLQTQITTLNSATGDYVLKIETGQFYSSNNPSEYAPTGYVTGISGNLQTQITNLNNATGSYALNSQTGQFYANSNPSGFITGIDDMVFTTGDQIISGTKTFTGSFNVSTHDSIIIRSTGYIHGVEIGGSFFNRIGDGGFINDFGVDGAENHFGDRVTSSNSFGGNAVANDFGAYATVNNYYGGYAIGLFDFDTLPTVNSTGVLLSGEATTQTYVTGISGSLQTQISTLNDATGNYVSSIPTDVTGASQISNIISITQAGYNAIASPLSETLYIIIG